MSVSEIISYLVSVISIVMAIWQTIKNSNLKKYIRTEAMEVYSITSILLGSAQECLKQLQGGEYQFSHAGSGKNRGNSAGSFCPFNKKHSSPLRFFASGC